MRALQLKEAQQQLLEAQESKASSVNSLQSQLASVMQHRDAVLADNKRLQGTCCYSCMACGSVHVMIEHSTAPVLDEHAVQNVLGAVMSRAK